MQSRHYRAADRANKFLSILAHKLHRLCVTKEAHNVPQSHSQSFSKKKRIHPSISFNLSPCFFSGAQCLISIHKIFSSYSISLHIRSRYALISHLTVLNSSVSLQKQSSPFLQKIILKVSRKYAASAARSTAVKRRPSSI